MKLARNKISCPNLETWHLCAVCQYIPCLLSSERFTSEEGLFLYQRHWRPVNVLLDVVAVVLAVAGTPPVASHGVPL